MELIQNKTTGIVEAWENGEKIGEVIGMGDDMGMAITHYDAQSEDKSSSQEDTYRTNGHLIGKVKVIEFDSEDDNMRSIGDSQFHSMPEDCYIRSAQIPVPKERFDYLMNGYYPRREDRYIMIHRPGHFIICENMSGNCVFDAAYSDLVDRKEEISNNNGYRIAAVITKIIINREWKQSEHVEDEFELLSDIILRIL